MSSSAPLVSICCITYNHEQFIREAVDGFLMQKTDFPIEIIIHDDASIDGTTKIIKEYQGKHAELIKLIIQTENQYKTRGFGFLVDLFQQAQGKYIALCEGDDYWTDPLKLQKQVDFLEANPDYSLVSHRRKVYDENIKQFIKNDWINYFDEYENTSRDWSVTEWPEVMPSTASIVFKKQVADEIFKINHSFVCDAVLIFVAYKLGRICNLPDYMSVYRVHSTGAWSSSSKIEKSIFLLKIIDALVLNKIYGDDSIEVFLKQKFDNFTLQLASHYNLSEENDLWLYLESQLNSKPENLSYNFHLLKTACNLIIQKNREIISFSTSTSFRIGNFLIKKVIILLSAKNVITASILNYGKKLSFNRSNNTSL